MSLFISNLTHILIISLPYWGLFLCSFVLCFVLTPLCRELARNCGMVDKPSARRINKTPIPRAGGVAVFLSTAVTLTGYLLLFEARILPVFPNSAVLQVLILGGLLAGVGLIDDKWGLPPLVKLAGQLGVAFAAHFWTHLGFTSIPILSGLPAWLDAGLTVFWIVGVVNAFNLIDGLDGLASGLALIASVGMVGALFFIGYPKATLVYFAFAGACLAFLRYNFNPASVFLGDSGSMFLGFFLATMPFLTKSGDSLMISLGVPLLAIGVPIFDTFLAILRRVIRSFLTLIMKDNEGNAHVMQADTDHLHHRLLRQFMSQRKAATVLYMMSAALVLFGLGGILLRARAAGLYVVGFIVAVVIIVRDMQRIELWDSGRLLNAVAHAPLQKSSLRARLSMPFYVVLDLFLLVLTFTFSLLVLNAPLTQLKFHVWMPLQIASIFFALIFIRNYRIVWSRALLPNFLKLILAVFVGVFFASALITFLNYPHQHLFAFSFLYFLFASSTLCGLRLLRAIVREVFYLLDRQRLMEGRKASRILVYGAGLRYHMFRRELIRSTSANGRVIVGLLDHDTNLKDRYIGGIRIYGPLTVAKDVIRDLHVDAVVIACQLSPRRLEFVTQFFREAGVAVTVWECEEIVPDKDFASALKSATGK